MFAPPSTMADVRRRYANVPARTKNTIARTKVSPARRFGIFRTTYAAARRARELLPTEMREYHWEASTISPRDVPGRRSKALSPNSPLSAHPPPPPPTPPPPPSLAFPPLSTHPLPPPP